MIDNVVILMPGAFKPLTPAHYKKIKEIQSLNKCSKLVLFIGYSNRDNITRNDAIYIIRNIFSITDVEIYDSTIKSPVLQIYEYMKEQLKGTYTLFASTKDDLNRIPNFVEKHKKGGKFNHDNIDAVYLDKILYYPESINNNIISATNIRDCIKNDNKEDFDNYYKDFDKNTVNNLYNFLKFKICQQPQVI